jgi:hypothetical protein
MLPPLAVPAERGIGSFCRIPARLAATPVPSDANGAAAHLARAMLTVLARDEGTVAMLTNVRGRVEMDPMAIPRTRGADETNGEAFAVVLDQAVAAEVPAPVDSNDPLPPAADAAVDTNDGKLAPGSEEWVATTNETVADGDGAVDAEPTASATVADVDATAVERADTQLKAPIEAAPNAVASRPSATAAEPLWEAVAQRRAGGAIPVLTNGNTSGAKPASPTAGPASLRGVAASGERTNAPLAAPAAATIYRSAAPAGAALLEQTRDSVFQQILLQLTPNGGEMRLRLQPPDLGELDLQLVVEHGNQLHLAISAERADLADLLRQNLDQLKATLRAAGLEVGEASVRTRDGSSREQERSDRGASSSRDEAVPTPTRRRRQATSGLDFWA